MGITLIVSPQWMFVCIINNPYHIDDDSQIPLYLDGYAYAGILTL